MLVAYSGGLDSTALLHALSVLRADIGVQLAAVHVHHGLQPEADRWVNHCQLICNQFRVPLEILRVEVLKQNEGLEAAARHARYRALKELVTAETCLLTAHQQDDQAETLMLQLLRGAGPEGLAAMPRATPFGDGWHARPLLKVSRKALTEYAHTNQLAWIEDPSNQDIAYDRNFLRQKGFPLLKNHWPGLSRTLARAADHQAAVSEIVREVADHDLSRVQGRQADIISIRRLTELSVIRQRNVLRRWLFNQGLATPSQRQLADVLQSVVKASPDRTPKSSWPGTEIRRYRDDLYAMTTLPKHDPGQVIRWGPDRPLEIPHLGLKLDVSQFQTFKGTHQLHEPVSIRFRQGGERCRPSGQLHHRLLKKLFQEAGIPPWQRDRIPLIYSGNELLAVWGYWRCG